MAAKAEYHFTHHHNAKLLFEGHVEIWGNFLKNHLRSRGSEHSREDNGDYVSRMNLLLRQ